MKNFLKENKLAIFYLFIILLILYILIGIDYEKHVKLVHFQNGKQFEKMVFFEDKKNIYIQSKKGIYSLCNVSQNDFWKLKSEDIEIEFEKIVNKLNEEKFCNNQQSSSEYLNNQFKWYIEALRQFGNVNSLLGLILGTSESQNKFFK